MQSVQQNQEKSKIDILNAQIEQSFLEVISIWKESDTKKIKAVQLLAARMEELYIQNGQADQINTISATISERLRSIGIVTAHHVHDYLDQRYKREKAQSQTAADNTDSGIIAAKNVLDLIIRKDPLTERTASEIQDFDEFAKFIEVHAKANKQAAEVRGIALLSSDPNAKKWPKVRTELPESADTVASEAWDRRVQPVIDTFQNVHKEIGKKLKDLPPDDAMAKAMVEPLHEYGRFLRQVFDPIDEFLGPYKDLKFATTKPKWWKIVLKYYEHGKHAAAVMEAINSHSLLEDRDIPMQIIKCPQCEYFVTVPNAVDTPMHLEARSAVNLMADHQLDTHEREARKLPIKIELGKVTVQVPKERDLTREQVGDKIQELVKLAISFVSSVKAFQYLAEWREKTADGRVATRRLDAHDKLSEFA